MVDWFTCRELSLLSTLFIFLLWYCLFWSSRSFQLTYLALKFHMIIVWIHPLKMLVGWWWWWWWWWWGDRGWPVTCTCTLLSIHLVNQFYFNSRQSKDLALIDGKCIGPIVLHTTCMAQFGEKKIIGHGMWRSTYWRSTACSIWYFSVVTLGDFWGSSAGLVQAKFD